MHLVTSTCLLHICGTSTPADPLERSSNAQPLLEIEGDNNISFAAYVNMALQ